MNKEDFNQEEILRLRTLEQFEILDTEPESDFDEIVRLASHLCETPISLISLIDEHRQWFKAKTGLEINETHRDFAFCAHAIHQDDLMIVEDATLDKRFVQNPLVTGSPSIRFYAGMPLTTSTGYKLGTLCVIDRKPKLLAPHQQLALRTLAKQVIKQFELRLKVKELNKAVSLLHQQELKLKQFNQTSSRLLSIIGHDLKSPMASLRSLLKLFEEGAISKEDLLVMVSKLHSVINSGEDLLDNLLVWGSTQLKGDDVVYSRILIKSLVDNIVQQNETVLSKKNNVVEVIGAQDLMLYSDKNILEFVLRNLLLNANKFSTNSIIQVIAKVNSTQTTIAVCDKGIGIDPFRIQALFSWEKRRSTPGTAGETGSGIGLKLCAELIDKLGGSLTATSAPDQGSTFTIVLPNKQGEKITDQ